MKSSSDKAGGQLLQELEALSQALYKSQSVPTSLPGNIPPPRREFDHINHRRRVSEAAGRPPKSAAAPAGSSLESRHSISGILPSQDQKLTSTIAGDIIPDEEEQHEDHHQESSIDLTHKKKGGIWSWKPLRALAHIGQHRLHCEFSAHIHSIEKLATSMNGLRLQIHLRHRDTGVHTQPARVSSGAAEFEEVLHFRCSVYASKSKSSVKYMSKSFTLSASAADIEELDLGKHQLDLTRILPSNALPTPESEHSSTSSWNTSFKLSGKARGGVLGVTFSYQILENGGGSAVGRTESGRFANVGIGSRSFNSLPSSPHTGNLHGKQPVKEFGSPARSEPGNEYGDMEHLDLDHDELPRSRNGGKSNSNSNSNLDSGGDLNLWKPPLPGRGSTRAIDVVEHRGKRLFEAGIAPGTPGRVEEQQQPVEKVEDEGVFSVVERGVETSALDEQDRSVFEEHKDDEQEEEDGGEKQEEEEEEETQEQVVQDQVKEDGDSDQELKQRYQADEQIDDEQDQDDQEQEEEQEEEEEEQEDDREEQVAEAQQEHEEQAPEVEQEEEENDDEDEEEYKQEELPVDVKLGLEQYDWKRELEEDDLYDSHRSPGMLSSSSSATPENYWKQQEEPPAPPPAPQKDEYRFEYQSDGDSEDEAGKVDVKDGDEEDELVADAFLDMLSGAPAPAASPPDNNLGSNELLREYSVESSDAEPLQKYEAEEDDDDDEEEEPDSPRALLLKQFEQEAMLEGGFGLDAEEEEVAAQLSFGSPIVPAFNLDEDEEPLGRLTLQQQQSSISSEASSPQQEQQQKQPDHTRVSSEEWNSDEDKELAAIMDAAESELQKATQAMKSKARAKMLEDAEAEALLQEWGLDENVFHDEEDQPPTAAGAHPEEPQGTESSSIVLRQGVPPLAPGIGSSVPTADGGTLRSMDTSHFQNGKNDGKLVMHVSKPVVVPAEMGATAIDVLRNLAAAGTENMAAEAMAAMPLEDITGKSVQQIAIEGQACYDESNKRYDAALVASNRYALEDVGVDAGALAAPAGSSAIYLPKQRNAPRQRNGEFLQLDELAPVAMEKIEELAMQGLKIQCDMADEDAPYVIDPAQNLPQLTGSGSTSRLLLEAGSSEGSSEGMIAMSLSLDEWMRLDAGLDDDEQVSDKSRAIMAAHREAHSTTDLVLNLTGEKKPSSSSGFGKMGDTLTLAMLVQLRDPLRNYEPVGAPMMALVEAERVLFPPKPKLWKRVALKGNSEAEYNDEAEEEKPVDPQPQFKITGVHMAGLNVQEDIKDPKKKNQLWGSQRQQQSGSRWLVANGMAKSVGSKHPLLKSSKPSKNREGASLWSISARPEVESSKPLNRNPDVKFGRLAAAGGFRKR